MLYRSNVHFRHNPNILFGSSKYAIESPMMNFSMSVSLARTLGEKFCSWALRYVKGEIWWSRDPAMMCSILSINKVSSSVAS